MLGMIPEYLAIKHFVFEIKKGDIRMKIIGSVVLVALLVL
jgi:hypothetical protein